MADDSNTSNVGGRYAQALFDLANDEKSMAKVAGDIDSLKKALAESRELRGFVSTLAYSAEDKGKALAALADKGRFHPTTKKFLGVLAANGRVSALPAVIAAFDKLSADQRGVVAAQVTTATPLTPAQVKGLAAALRQSLGKDPEIETRVDPSILGGVKVRVGSRLFDASLRSKLDSLKFALKRA